MDIYSFLREQTTGWNAAPKSLESWTSALGSGENAGGIGVSAEELEACRGRRAAGRPMEWTQAFANHWREASGETRQLTGEALALQQRVTSCSNGSGGPGPE